MPPTGAPAPPLRSAETSGAAPAPAPAAGLRPVSRVEPSFPREGIGLGARAVLLRARLTVAADGSVSQVGFIQSEVGARPFERAARSALLQWRFPPGVGERTYLQEVRFSEQ